MMSEADSDAAFDVFFPGILIPIHQRRRKTAMTPIATRPTLNNRRRQIETVVCNQPIFFRKRSAQRTKSAIDIAMRMARCGQYSRKLAPRRMIARMSVMK